MWLTARVSNKRQSTKDESSNVLNSSKKRLNSRGEVSHIYSVNFGKMHALLLDFATKGYK